MTPPPALRRHPGDILRVSIGVAGLAAAGVVTSSRTVPLFERDLFRLVNDLPAALSPPMTAVMQAGQLGAVPAVAAVAALARRARLSVDVLVAGGAGWLAAKAVKHVVLRPRPAAVLGAVHVRGLAQAGAGFPSGHVAVAAALATVCEPYVPRRVRWLLWGAVGMVGLARVYVGAHLPADVVGGALVGWTVGALVRLVRGTPGGDITPAEVITGVAGLGIELRDVRPVDGDARGSRPFLAVAADGGALFVKHVGREQRNADLLYRAWRAAAFRNANDLAPVATPRQEVEHEAYVSLLAARSGVRTPATVVTGPVARGGAVLVQEAVAGDPLDRRADVSDAALGDMWRQVARLHDGGIAHRDLRAANVIVGRDSRTWLVDFGFASAGASMVAMAQDVAELLVSSALVVGPARAAAAAHDVLGDEALRAALPYIQPLALSAATRRAARRHDELVDAVRSAVVATAGGDDGATATLLRSAFRPSLLLGIVAAAFGLHVLLPLAGGLGGTLHAVRTARVPWLLAALGASAFTYLAAAMQLSGAADGARTTARGRVLVQLATSFTSRLAPAGFGRVTLVARFLERAGCTRPEATAAITVSTLGSVVVHVGATVVVAVLAGRTSALRPHVPARWGLYVAVGAAVGVVAYLATRATPYARRAVRSARAVLATLVRVVRRKRQAARLFGGAGLVLAGYVAALELCLVAVGITVPLTHVALVYLVGSAVASVAPSPGGIGAVEASLSVGLTGLGVPSGPAVAAVLAFRLVTFWLPVLPGAFALTVLRRRGAV